MSSVPDLIGWVHEGERLFGAVLHTLRDYEQLRARADGLEQENRQLREQIQIINEELAGFRAERIEAAATLRAIAEHVTRLATVALQRLGKPVA
jgi:septal ring factor EnvC (AmiA/AmiB activator)